MSLLSLGRYQTGAFPLGTEEPATELHSAVSEQILAKNGGIGGSTCTLTSPPIRDREGTDRKGWGVLLKGRNVLISPGYRSRLPRHLGTSLSMARSCCVSTV